MANSSKSNRERGPDYARSMREKAVAAAKRRKEDYIGARVPKALRDGVIAVAEREGLPVSLWIRKVLEAAVANGANATEAVPPVVNVKAVADPGGQRRFPQVLGWERIQLNQAVTCAVCSLALEPGGQATVGISVSGGAPLVLCEKCSGVI